MMKYQLPDSSRNISGVNLRMSNAAPIINNELGSKRSRDQTKQLQCGTAKGYTTLDFRYFSRLLGTFQID